MSFWALPGFITLLEQSGFSAQRHRLHFNILLAQPFLFCAMVLVAATFSLRMQRRGGAALMIIGGVVAGFLLYFVSDYRALPSACRPRYRFFWPLGPLLG